MHFMLFWTNQLSCSFINTILRCTAIYRIIFWITEIFSQVLRFLGWILPILFMMKYKNIVFINLRSFVMKIKYPTVLLYTSTLRNHFGAWNCLNSSLEGPEGILWSIAVLSLYIFLLKKKISSFLSSFILLLITE